MKYILEQIKTALKSRYFISSIAMIIISCLLSLNLNLRILEQGSQQSIGGINKFILCTTECSPIMYIISPLVPFLASYVLYDKNERVSTKKSVAIGISGGLVFLLGKLILILILIIFDFKNVQYAAQYIPFIDIWVDNNYIYALISILNSVIFGTTMSILIYGLISISNKPTGIVSVFIFYNLYSYILAIIPTNLTAIVPWIPMLPYEISTIQVSLAKRVYEFALMLLIGILLLIMSRIREQKKRLKENVINE